MGFLNQVAHFFATGSNWTGSGGIIDQLVGQVELSAVAITAAVVVGAPLGALMGHSGRGSFVVVNAANAARAVPSFALLTLLAIQPAIVRLQDGGFVAAAIAMFALAVPPVLTNAYIGVREVDPAVRSAALAMGMKPGQVLRRVELPLAAPLLMAGVRTAAVEVVATATLAAYVNFTDLGNYIISGLANQDDVETFCGAVLVAALALLVDLAMAGAGRLLTPAAVARPARRVPGGGLRGAGP
jgi:osmoprotectant transport system permease protein